MKTPFSIFFLLLLGVLACGTATPHAAPDPATVTPASAIPTNESVATESLPPTSTTELQPDLSMPLGLRVIYLRGGNLWSWTEAGGSSQLTDTGDMSTARVSSDGRLLAFIRGREVWTINMDGTDARLVQTLADEGAALWFSPDGSLLAVSTQDHIEVVDLVASSSSTLVTYPDIPHNYYPEVVWTSDSSGFKTVIPAPVDAGQAELLFVFTNGTVASLAKFSMAPLTESFSFISPDGGYIIYVAKLDDGNGSLYLMDSSGANKPYGEPGKGIRTLGWLPDSLRFAYGDLTMKKAFLGNVGSGPTEISIVLAPIIRWIDVEHYLAIENGDLLLNDLSAGSVQIDSNVQDFDFVP